MLLNSLEAYDTTEITFLVDFCWMYLVIYIYAVNNMLCFPQVVLYSTDCESLVIILTFNNNNNNNENSSSLKRMRVEELEEI